MYGGKEWAGVTVDGHRRFNFRRKNYYVAVLVCEAFHGPKPFSGALAMHRDGNTLNNAADNLRWATKKEVLNSPTFLAYASATCCAKMAGKQTRT